MKNNQDNKLGLYIHIPFCREKCDYCSFYSVPLINYRSNYCNEIINDFIDILLIELEERSTGLSNYIADTVYFGGGTPSLLNPTQIGRILNTVNRFFKMDKMPEITVECNPGDFSIKKLKEYQELGVNRVVLGVQTMNAKLHSAIGRSADICTDRLLSDFAGFPDIVHCIDIIIGIPGQAGNDLLKELNEITCYGFEHISAYTLSIEQNTPLYKRYIPDRDFNDLQRELLETTIDYFINAGYIHYEVSNYALPLYESKHNLKYWMFIPYAGFGPGAHSFYNGERFYNPNSIEKYFKYKGRILQKDERTKNSEIVEYILSGLRLSYGISLTDFKNKLQIIVPDKLYEKFIELKARDFMNIEESNNDTIVRFTKSGFFQMDGLIYEMVEMFL
ncbi:MAG: radical SAM family heme chaperone HemW [Spirochaetes bacterium]|nr:radical SAM family heme chaperone HemW [Spirochaetota bacterium]